MTAAAAITMLVILYLRVSTEDQKRKGYSLPDQRAAGWNKIRELAKELEETLSQPVQMDVREFEDTYGGDILNRPVLDDVRAFLRTHRPRYFVCLNLDRFSRDLEIQLKVTKEILAVGCDLEFVEYDFSPDPEGMLQFQVRGAVSEFEKKQILKRTSRGKQRKVAQGGRPNGACPLGYTHNKETDQLEIDEVAAHWVRQLFRWVGLDGITPYQAAKRLNANGVPTRLGGLWRRSTVIDMLRNTTYMGQMRCNRHDFRGLGSIRRLPRDKREMPITGRIRAESEWKIATVPAIIDAAIFHLVQSRLDSVRRTNRGEPYLLSSILRCGVCGNRMMYSYNKKRGYGYLVCPRRYATTLAYRCDPCTNEHHRIDRIEQELWNQVVAWLLNPDLLAVYLHEDGNEPAANHLAVIAQEIDLLQARLTELQGDQMMIMQKQKKGLLTEAVGDSLLASAAETCRQVEASLADLRNRQRTLQEKVSSAEATKARLADLALAIASEQAITQKQLDQLNQAQRRNLILQLIRNVVINRDGTWSLEFI